MYIRATNPVEQVILFNHAITIYSKEDARISIIFPSDIAKGSLICIWRIIPSKSKILGTDSLLEIIRRAKKHFAHLMERFEAILL